jgi:hypothetical protein
MAGILEPQGLRRICCTEQARWLERMAHVRHFTGGSRGSTPVSETHGHEVVNRVIKARARLAHDA